jgi:hypothetical protein
MAATNRPHFGLCLLQATLVGRVVCKRLRARRAGSMGGASENMGEWRRTRRCGARSLIARGRRSDCTIVTPRLERPFYFEPQADVNIVDRKPSSKLMATATLETHHGLCEGGAFGFPISRIELRVPAARRPSRPTSPGDSPSAEMPSLCGRPSSQSITGTSARPSFCAAFRRRCPSTTSPSLRTRQGILKPNSRIDEHILSTAPSFLRGLRV